MRLSMIAKWKVNILEVRAVNTIEWHIEFEKLMRSDVIRSVDLNSGLFRFDASCMLAKGWTINECDVCVAETQCFGRVRLSLNTHTYCAFAHIPVKLSVNR